MFRILRFVRRKVSRPASLDRMARSRNVDPMIRRRTLRAMMRAAQEGEVHQGRLDDGPLGRPKNA
jgi:hypothetical protein